MNAMAEVPRPHPDSDPFRMRTWNARDLIGDDVQTRILLDGQVYYLRITRAGKLILTK